MERVCAAILRSGGCGPSLWEENRRREKIAATPKKITIGDDRYFVSALEQGFGPAFFFVFLVGVTFGSLCAVMGYFVYHKRLSVARPAGNSALWHVLRRGNLKVPAQSATKFCLL
jgi:hypothetical protein